jgi:hypothetical protein
MAQDKTVTMFAGNRNAAFMDAGLATLIWNRIRHLLHPLTFDKATEKYHSASGYNPLHSIRL